VRPLATAEQMRNLDQRAMAEFSLPGLVLMENAGRGMARILARDLAPLQGKRVGILCGRGNNGGDGFVIGRWLARSGARIRFFLLAEPDQIGGDARVNLEAARALGLPLRTCLSEADLEELPAELAGLDVIVDALLGTGLKSEVRGLFRRAIEAVNAAPGFKAAVDVPSGLDADTGLVRGLAVRADLTVTFGLAKLGQALYPGLDCCGRLEVLDICLPDRAVAEAGLSHFEPEASDAALWWPRLAAEAHKGSAGHLLVLAGSPGKTGAACLTAAGALRSGAGLVTVGCPASLNPILESKLTEAMTWPLAETTEATLGLVSRDGLTSLLEGKDALAVGPGLSTHPEVGELLAWLLERFDGPMVLDADGLNLLSQKPELARWAAGPLVLTPHPGEMARLLGLSAAEIQADRVGAARRLAADWGQVIVLKGARSVIASPDGRVLINPTGNPGLASGGSGDVLTGIIGALLAQGVKPLEAAAAGVFVHGLAADLLAADLGGRGFLAGQVAEAVPRAVASLTDGPTIGG